MPRILPTIAAVIVVGICIAVNTMRYPIVWQMVGPNARTAVPENIALSADTARPASAESPTLAGGESVKPLAGLDPPTNKESDKASLGPAVPIALRQEEAAPVETNEKDPAAEKAETDNSSDAEKDLIEPSRPLVPVASDPIFVGAALPQGEEIRRLPPVEMEVAFPADRYTAEYPPATVPIYPSTGK
jgi:hypothetical protein